jgi:predicted dehydrogenase
MELSATCSKLFPRLLKNSRRTNPLRISHALFIKNGDTNVRVGLIGFGLAGQVFHAPLIRAVPEFELACILERHGTLAAQKYLGVRVARTIDELLEDEQIRLCVIATPNLSHFELAQRCLLAGRDVVIDKPFTTTAEEARTLIQLAEDRGRLLTVFQNRRWDGDFLTVRKLIAAGSLGRIVFFESHYDRFRPVPKVGTWRERGEPGGGVLYDLGSHIIDQVLLLFGKPKAVTADVFAEREGSLVDDAFLVQFEYGDMRAIMRSTMLAAAPGPRFIVHGTKGSFVKYGSDVQEQALRQWKNPAGPNWGENPESEWGTLYLPNSEITLAQKVKTESGDYRCFYSNVRDALLKGAPLAVPARESLLTMRAIELALRSCQERRTVDWVE